MFDVPGKQNAGDGDDAGEQQQDEADAVGGEVIVNAERRNPRDVGDGEHLAGAVLQEGRERDGERDQRRQQREDARGRGVALRQQQEQQRSEKRDVDRPSQHR